MAASSASKKRKLEFGPDAFDCPICAHPLTGRIFQCPAGHHLCEECLEELRVRRQMSCPTCRTKFPKTVGRNLALEALAASCSFPCRWGCGKKGTPDVLQAHAPLCEKGTVQCPMDDCEQAVPANELVKHLRSVHKVATWKSGTTEVLTVDNLEPGDWDPVLVLSQGYRPVLFSMCFCKEGRNTPSLLRANVQHFTGAPKRYVFKMSGPRGTSLAFSSSSSFIRSEIEEDQIVFGKEVVARMLRKDADRSDCMKIQLSIVGLDK